MQSEAFDTRKEAPSRQFDAWQGWWSGFDSVASGPVADGFPARTEIWQIGDVTVSRVNAPAIRAIRSRAHIRRAPYDHWNIVVGLRGATNFEVGTERVVLPRGLPIVVSLGVDVTSDRGADERIQLYLPRDRFADLAPVLDRACGVVADTPAARLLADYIAALTRRLPDLDANDVPSLGAAVGSMVAACMQPNGDLGRSAGEQLGFARMERVRRITRTHLRAPMLDTAFLCREAGISRSQLYRLLEAHGGVARWIQRQRLLESHALLSDISYNGTITAVAQEMCFEDASTFSRVFRREFGVSPRDVRAAALAGVALPARDDRWTDCDVPRFADYLAGYARHTPEADPAARCREAAAAE